ncbi:MAG: cell wall metabolism sensor histidine kinase WalK [Tissierellia bacterium]|nr:cell wall metabolism sensor histidine kinase WalK [Tissierellia bacterium]
MFSSIKWRLIIINFILVLIAMMIVGFTIVDRLDTQQVAAVSAGAIQDMRAISDSGTAFKFPRWTEVTDDLQEAIDDWRLSSEKTLYVISDRDHPVILASTVSANEMWKMAHALAYKNLLPTLILEGFNDKQGHEIVKDDDDSMRYMHVVYPVLDDLGSVRGLLYMITDLQGIDTTLQQAKIILTRATLVAVVVIMVLGYLLAIGITGPIRDVTKKAEEMAGGNFDQRVEIKSNDEIGQLGSMFNYLTGELKMNIGKINYERNKLDTIFHYMAEGVLGIDASTRLIQANPFAMRVLELEEKDIDQKVPELWDRLALPRDEKGNPTFKHGESHLALGRLHLNVKYAPFRNEWGDLDGLIVVLQDMTKERRLDAVRKDFVANVSHELKTPITTVKTYVETMRQMKLPQEQQEEFLGIIEEESERMNLLVQDLLTLSNLDYGQYQTEMEPLSVNGLISQGIHRLKWLREEKNHNIEVEKAPGNPMAIGQRDAVERAFVNLLSNAMKYTPNDGTIKIHVEEEPGKVIIIVEDNGIGIPQDDQERIFERFYRVEKGRSRSMGGTGLGLAIARESIRANGGDIKLKSVFGEGTTVKLFLKKLEEDVTGI